MRRWLLVTVAAVALSACTNTAIIDADPYVEGETAGNTALFCRAWPEARRTVINMLEGEDQRFQDARSAGSVDETMAGYDRAAPAEVRTDWDRLYGVYTRASDLIFTVGYAGHNIRAEHVTMMFGPGGMESAVSEASSAIAAIDDWSIEACGNFCSRWSELESILRYEEHVDQGSWQQNLDRYELALAAGARLVPDNVEEFWGIAAGIQTRRFVMFRENDFRLDVDEGTALRKWGVHPWDEEKAASDAALHEMSSWVEANCEPSAITGGAPGTLSVRIRPHDDLVGRTILVALLPVGTDFGSVTDPGDYLGALCPEIHQPPGPFDREVARAVNESGRSEEEILDEWLGVEPLRPMLDVGEYHEGSICGLLQYDEGGRGALVVPGGTYELFAGTFVGNPGSYALYFAAPERCAQVTVNIDGDTVIDLPELDACDLEPIGSAEETARRPSTPMTGEGRLWIEVPSGLYQEGSPAYFTAVILPTGTTLGEISRGNAWPTGGVSFGYVWLDWLGGDEDPRRVLRAEESGLVPILPYGPGGGVVNIGPQIDWQDPWDAFFPEPAALDPGTYILRTHGGMESEDCRDDSCRRQYCGSAVVEIDGDTAVPLPEWGECP
jgi:hypothetical protein